MQNCNSLYSPLPLASFPQLGFEVHPHCVLRFFFEGDSLCVALVVLELNLDQFGLKLRLTSFCLQSAGIKDKCQYTSIIFI